MPAPGCLSLCGMRGASAEDNIVAKGLDLFAEGMDFAHMLNPAPRRSDAKMRFFRAQVIKAAHAAGCPTVQEA